jgi:predicted phosphodiesterase
MQLGDLFDFWIGLQCPFDLIKGAREFPDTSSASKFVNYWLNESLRNHAINFLWNFDQQDPPVTDDRLKTVFLYGNHDTYMGTSLPSTRAPLPGQFVEPGMGLIAQHGHQDDAFNNEPTAGIGYLLTQAVFCDNYVRTIEDPMSSLKTKLFGGMWTRLGYNEVALKNCLFQRLETGAKPAAIFVMGHTHEPALQRVDVVEVIPVKPELSSPPPQERPIPRQLTYRPKIRKEARATVVFKQVHVLDQSNDEPWNIRAFVSSVSNKDQSKDVKLVDEISIEKGKVKEIVAPSASALVTSDEQVEIVIQGWQGHRARAVYDPSFGSMEAGANYDPFFGFMEAFWNYTVGRVEDFITPDFLKSKPEVDIIAVRVWPNTWEGTRTLDSKNLRVTFSLDWEQG